MVVVYAILGCSVTSAAMCIATMLGFIHAWQRADDTVIVVGIGIMSVLFAAMAVIYGIIGTIIRNSVKE